MCLYPVRNFTFEIIMDSFQSEMEGLTGLIKFDTAGFRSNFQLDIVRVTENGLKKIGIWNSTNDVEWLLEARPQKSEEELSLQNKTFLILIAIVRKNTKLRFLILFMVSLNEMRNYRCYKK